MNQNEKTRLIHDLAAAALILRILEEVESTRRHNFIVAADGSRVGLSDARQFIANVINEMVEIV